uniref:Sigma non-opioid intracellular receptor 1 n=1 Tax=Heterorhabditis bacteriophora TaxID=37862 RepID=A0A1I7XSU9_HETBA
MGFLFSKLVRNIVIAYIIFSGIQFLLRWKSYTISPKEFRSIASKAQGTGSIAVTVSRLSSDLSRAYVQAISSDTPWVALCLGGMNLKALFLHASITEFIAVLGSPFPTSGRIGLHWSNSTCTVLTGSVSRLTDTANLANKEVFNTGSNFRHGQFESHIYSFGDDTYIACYGRGVIPVSGLWAVTGAISQGEPLSVAHLAFAYGQATFNQISIALTKTLNYYKNKATGKSEL